PERGAGREPVSVRWLAPLLLVFALTVLYTGTETTIGGWLFTYARDAIGQDATAASLATSLLWLAILSGRLAAIRALRRLSSVAMLRLCVGGGAAGLAVILAGQAWSPLFWFGVTLTGFCFGPVFPTALALSSELAPRQAGAASSLVVASGSVGAMVLPWSAGALIPYIGIAGSMAAAFLPLCLMLIFIWAIGQRMK
ncbi:MAG: MFS transporter, partial [Anaerolineae bacterium]|nr:MFS transporter [Anaerolineae bacterium]